GPGRPPHRVDRPGGELARMALEHRVRGRPRGDDRLVPGEPGVVAEGPRGRADGPDGLTLIVLGGAPAQRQAIDAAQRLGVTAVVCDSRPGAGDVTVSTEDTGAVRSVARDRAADGLIAPGTDWPVRIAAYVAEVLGLPHPVDVATAVRCTNKL